MGIFDFFKKKKENKENSAPENIVKEAEVLNPQVTEPQTTNKEEEKVVPKEMADFDALSLGELLKRRPMIFLPVWNFTNVSPKIICISSLPKENLRVRMARR